VLRNTLESLFVAKHLRTVNIAASLFLKRFFCASFEIKIYDSVYRISLTQQQNLIYELVGSKIVVSMAKNKN
jgi:hypothetical protein